MIEEKVLSSGRRVADDWEFLLGFLPNGWEEDARRCGAFVRSRGVSDPAHLLRLLLIHLADGCSLQETVERARLSGLATLSAPSLHHRLEHSEEWLRRLALGVRRRILTGSDVIYSRYPWNIRAVDATTVSEPGSTGTDWRLHYSVNLAQLNCDYFQLSSPQQGESLLNFPVSPGDLLLADRGYSHRRGIEHVVQQGGHVLLRINWKCIRIFTKEGKPFDPVRRGRALRVGQASEWDAYVADAEGRPVVHGRIVGIRKSANQHRKAQLKVQRRCRRLNEKVTPRALALSAYVYVFTTLERGQLPTEHVLELYRGRWQVELAFKHLKSIMGFGHLPKRSEKACRAWLHGKLLVALLVQAMIQAGWTFSPWGYALRLGPVQQGKPLA